MDMYAYVLVDMPTCTVRSMYWLNLMIITHFINRASRRLMSIFSLPEGYKGKYCPPLGHVSLQGIFGNPCYYIPPDWLLPYKPHVYA